MKRDPEAGQASPPVLPRKSIFREYLVQVLGTAVLALFGVTFCVQAFEIPSESMEDTLLIGDRPLVNKLAYAPRTPWLGTLLPYEQIRRGDIVVFKHPEDPSRVHLVKRVIGLHGDRLRIVARQVFVNGRPLEEGYKVHKIGTVEDYRDSFPAAPRGPVYPQWAQALPRYVKDGWLVVPEGRYFVMGDNRDYSLDSRYWGFVPRQNILGKPQVIFWSFEKTGKDYKDVGPAGLLVGTLGSLVDLPRKTRWGRVFLVIHGAYP